MPPASSREEQVSFFKVYRHAITLKVPQPDKVTIVTLKVRKTAFLGGNIPSQSHSFVFLRHKASSQELGHPPLRYAVAQLCSRVEAVQRTFWVAQLPVTSAELEDGGSVCALAVMSLITPQTTSPCLFKVRHCRFHLLIFTRRCHDSSQSVHRFYVSFLCCVLCPSQSVFPFCKSSPRPCHCLPRQKVTRLHTPVFRRANNPVPSFVVGLRRLEQHRS
mmetsp:Transcript_54561/g.133750  ORF Transcript_54561/g.133750 Transcript_54561/m.133750 type:complete len:218 (+) Transcript_54561:285-938(+)